MKLVVTVIALFSLCLASAEEKKIPRIYSLHIRSDIKYRFSTTLVTSKVVNPDTESREATFDVTLPNEAFISKFKLIINNKTYDGEVKEKEEAKQQYDAAKAKGQSAGHIVAKPRETNKFQIMVNVAAAEKVTFELTYQEVLKRTKGRYSHVTYIQPGAVVDDMLIEVAITESRDLTSLKVPAIRSDKLTDVDIEKNNQLAVIERPSPRTAYIRYQPDADHQRQESDQGVNGQFTVEYDIDRENNAGELLVVNGYFVHYFAPDGLPSLPMDVIFILDKSGSMSGKKMDQLKQAMKKILPEMGSDDRFTIMTFDSQISFWKNELVSVSDDSLREAADFVDKIPASGLTNINDALSRGIDLLTSATESSRAPVIVFLTDGQPTASETNPTKILSNIREKNEGEIPIFSLAFGRGADYQFTRKLAAQNNGLGRKIYEDSDSALQISGLYKEISTVLMKDITFRYLDANVNQSSLTKTNFNTFFGGKEILVCGFLDGMPSLVITPAVARGPMSLEVTGSGVNGTSISLVLPDAIVLPDENGGTDDVSLNLTNKGDFSKITEKLWAYLTIKQLLQEKDTVDDDSRLKELDQQILTLSLKYQFVTPLTSMVVTMPDELKATPRLIEEDSQLAADLSLQSLPPSSSFMSGGGFGQQLSYNGPVSASFPSRGPMGYNSLPLPMVKKRMGVLNIPRRPRPTHTSIMLPVITQTTTTTTATTTTTTATPVTTRATTTTTQRIKSTQRIASPNLFIRIRGLNLPLCMDLDLEDGAHYSLFNITSSGYLLTVMSSKLGKGRRQRSLFTSVSYQSCKTTSVPFIFRPVPKYGDSAVILDSGKSGVDVYVIQKLDARLNHLKIYVKMPTKRLKNMDGLLDVFNGMKGRLVKQLAKNGRSVGKIKLRKGSMRMKVRALELQNSLLNINSCWYMNRASLRKLNVDVSTYRL